MYHLIVLFMVVQLVAVNKMLFLRILIYTISVISGLYFLYFVIIATGIFKKKKEKILYNKKNNFAIIIAARNEEMVIGNLVNSLNKQNYPKENYEIYVVINNCTDNTEKNAKDAGANIILCTDKVKSKGEVLRFAFAKLKQEKNIDAYVIFDADNIVHKDFLTKMNDSLNMGYSVVQGFRDTKNLSDSWLSCSYAIMYYIQNLFLNKARYNLGKSAFINGTGFVIKKEIVDKNGYDPKTLTEDIEFVAICAIIGEKIAFNDEAITYDEQVNKFIPSLKQRKRWSVGNVECLRGYFSKLLKVGFKDKRFECFDIAIYYIAIIIQAVSCIASILAMLILFINFQNLNINTIASTLIMSVCTYVVGVFIRIFLLKRYNKSIKDNISGILFFDLFILSWIPVNIACLFIKKCNWESIKHNRNIKIEEV